MINEYLIEQLVKNHSLLEKFCEIYKVKFIGTSFTDENEFLEPRYYFTDNLGGYTIKGLENSLKD
jgi:hypothetical protein